MKPTFSGYRAVRMILPACLAAVLVILPVSPAPAQQPDSNVTAQHAAMQKLAFLTGRWSGPVTIQLGPGRTLHLTQSENVQSTLGGLVLLIEGKSTTADGKAEFSALATIAFDNATHTYHIRAYNNGNYVDTTLSVLAQGFSWSFPAGPGRITNTMHLTAEGEWKEASDFVMGSAPPRPSVQMLLRRLP